MAGPPDPDLVQELRQVILTPKFWVSVGENAWVDAGGRPKGLKFRSHLALAGGLQPATLFVHGYYKTSLIPGAQAKLSLSLFYKNYRIYAIDENGPSRHYNAVGTGRPFHLQYVPHPHVHTVSDDALDGYAEPLEPTTMEEYWTRFLNETEIQGAPPLNLPPAQQELPLT